MKSEFFESGYAHPGSGYVSIDACTENVVNIYLFQKEIYEFIFAWVEGGRKIMINKSE